MWTSETPADRGRRTPRSRTGGHGGRLLRMGITTWRKGNGYHKFMTAICNGHSPTDTSVRWCGKVAVNRFYSGVGIFNWYYLSSPPQILRCSRFPLETGGLMYVSTIFACTGTGNNYSTCTLRGMLWSHACGRACCMAGRAGGGRMPAGATHVRAGRAHVYLWWDKNRRVGAPRREETKGGQKEGHA